MKISFGKKGGFSGLIFLILILALSFFKLTPEENHKSCLDCGENEEKLYKVARVIDGDTIEIENGQKVRYIGVDTPEMNEKDTIKKCYAQEAFKINKKLVENKEIRLEKDVSETDKYNRLLRYVYVDDVFVNDYLVKNGYAMMATYPPDVKYQNLFQESQKQAIEEKLGLWGGTECEP